MDKQGMVWAGTPNGLSRFDRVTESFVRYIHDPNDPNSISGDYITCIYEDKKGAFWIGTLMNGLNKMNRTTGMFQQFWVNSGDSLSWNNRINCIYEDQSANFWIGTGEGMFHFNRKDNSFSRVLQKDHNPGAPKSQKFAFVYEDLNSNYWIRTYSGLYQFDSSLKRIEAWEHTTRTFSDNSVLDNTRSIYQDSSGILWYTKHYGGIEKLVPKNKKFRYHGNNPNIEFASFSHIYVENKEVIWMGTWKGLSRYNRKKNEYQLFQHNPKDPNSISSNYVTGLLRDRKGNLWVGTDNGLNRLVLTENNTYRFIQYKHDPDDPASISDDDINSITEDHSGRLFITFYNGKFDIFDEEKEGFFHLEYFVEDQKFNQFGYILLIEPDRIWTGSRMKGLSEIILPFRKSKHHKITPDTIIHYKSKPGGLNVNFVTSVYKDNLKNTYWIGTKGGGLNKMVSINDPGNNVKEFRFEYYTTKNGLCNDNVNTILEDKKGRLWLGTENGLSKFDPITETFTNYDRTDGLLNYAFSTKACKSPDGEMFFPSDNGLLSFHPDSIEDNPIIPPVVITDFQIFNESVPVGGKSPLHESISSTTEIKLPYNQNFLSFEFAALNYIHPEKNQYKYKMDGLDPEWIEAGTRRHADYPDLEPGNYTFKVIGSNNNGIWNTDGVSLKIMINPPWWATYYAYTGYALFIALLIFGYVRWRTWQITKERDKLEK
ncbi:MAG: hypothetical protein KAQ62_18200, partial [Cyclobacteriaceae bacterium]|nr:hypothetical protein [Cyclobacteriaceae bacterium]